MSHTRPNIAFAVGIVSQFMHEPNEEHMNAMVRIPRYLIGASGKGLLFSKINNLEVEYTDVDWAGYINDRRSTSGYCTFGRSNLVTWRSKKQLVVARSSTEAEFKSITLGIC